MMTLTCLMAAASRGATRRSGISPAGVAGSPRASRPSAAPLSGGLSLFRTGFHADPVTPMQPQPAYYAMRNFATATDGLHATKREEAYALKPQTLELPFEVTGDIWLYEPLNGVRQKLNAKVAGGRTAIAGLMVGDSPVIVRF